jgi:signal peptidase I
MPLCLLVGLVSLALFRLALIGGLLQPLRIASGSMAPNLLGPHFECRCDDCTMTWPFDARQPNQFDRLVCPNCGYVNARTPEQLPLRSGERILVDRWPYLLGSPQRGDVVLFETTDDSRTLAVKRLVGLPGEQISIREGDLYQDGEIIRKSLDQLRSLAVPVHDDRFTPQAADLPPRWSPDGPGGWLSFRPWRCYDNPLPRADETRLVDNDGYNQGTSRRLHAVFDLLLVGHADFSRADQLWIRGHDGLSWYTIRADFAEQSLTLQRDGELVVHVPWRGSRQKWSGRWEFALFDRQVVLAVNGREMLNHPVNSGLDSPGKRAVDRPLAIRQGPDDVSFTGRRVYRDLHYLHPHGGSRSWNGPRLGVSEYLVLGDNVPISSDGRSDRLPLQRKQLLGRVLRCWFD